MNETLCALFAQALGLERFGPDDDFFGRGGQSVAALLLMNRINEAFDLCLAPSDLFAAPTPALLARRLTAGRGESGHDDSEPAGVLPDGRFPLSAAQQDLLARDTGPETGAFGLRHLMVSTWRLTGPVDPLALQDALDDLVVRHEILRTEVERAARPPYQTVGPPGQVRLSIRYLPAPESGPYRDLLAGHVAVEAGTEPFDVRDLPLLRATLVRFEPEDAVLVLVAHQSAVDAWSAQVLMRDLAACYEARRTREPVDLPTAVPYRVYARESARELRHGPDAADLAFWREHLAGARAFGFVPNPPALLDACQGRYGAYRFRVEEREAGAVARCAAEASATPYMVLLTAFCLLAREHGGGEDLTMTAVGAGRDRARHPDTVGPFVNRLAIRVDLAGVRTFRQALARVRTACLHSYDHELPFGVVTRLAPDLLDQGSATIVPDFELLQSPLLGQVGKAAGIGFAEEHKALIPDVDGPDLSEGMRWSFAQLSPSEYVGTLQYPREHFSPEAVTALVAGYLRILRRCARAER